MVIDGFDILETGMYRIDSQSFYVLGLIEHIRMY